MYHTGIEIASPEIFIYHRKQLYKIAVIIDLFSLYISMISCPFTSGKQILIMEELADVFFDGSLLGPAMKATDLLQQSVLWEP